MGARRWPKPFCSKEDCTCFQASPTLIQLTWTYGALNSIAKPSSGPTGCCCKPARELYRQVDAYLKLVERCDARWELSDAVVAGEGEVSHVDQVQHALRKLWEAPLDVINAWLHLWGLIAVQNQFLQLAQRSNGCKILNVQCAADALQTQHLRMAVSLRVPAHSCACRHASGPFCQTLMRSGSGMEKEWYSVAQTTLHTLVVMKCEVNQARL